MPAPPKTVHRICTIAWTDGSCTKDGHGGWGVHLRRATGLKVELCGGQPNTTISVMELQATIMACHMFPFDEPCVLYSDSKFVIEGITDQIDMWLRTNWRTSANKPLMHVAMWQELYALSQAKQIDFRWVKGHSGDFGNDRADELALQGRLLLQPQEQAT